MALPTSNIKIVDVATVLIGGILPSPIKMADMFTHPAINKYGLSPTYVAGADADARLTTLQTTPYKLGHFRGYDHTATPISTFDAAVFIDVGTLRSGQDVNGTITVYKTSDDSQVGLIAQVTITTDTQYYFNNIPEEYYIVWNLTKRTNGTPILTSISWTEGLTFTMGSGQNSGNWNADTDFTVFIT